VTPDSAADIKQIYEAFAESTEEWIQTGELQDSLPSNSTFSVLEALPFEELDAYEEYAEMGEGSGEGTGGDGGPDLQSMNVDVSLRFTFLETEEHPDFANSTNKEERRALEKAINQVLSETLFSFGGMETGNMPGQEGSRPNGTGNQGTNNSTPNNGGDGAEGGPTNGGPNGGPGGGSFSGSANDGKEDNKGGGV